MPASLIRVCGTPGCGVKVSDGGSFCPACRSARERKRGTHTERGYDAPFERAKRRPEYRLATHCVTCGDAFTPDNPKTGGHSVAIRNGGRDSVVLPQCRRCNYGWERTGL